MALPFEVLKGGSVSLKPSMIVTETADGLTQIAPALLSPERQFTTILSRPEEIETILGLLAEGPKSGLYTLDQDLLRRYLIRIGMDAGPIIVRTIPADADKVLEAVRFSVSQFGKSEDSTIPEGYTRGVRFDHAFGSQRRVEFNGAILSLAEQRSEINRVATGWEYQIFKGIVERQLRSTIIQGSEAKIELAVGEARDNIMGTVQTLTVEQISRLELGDEEGAEEIGRFMNFILANVYPLGYRSGRFPGELEVGTL